jgi:cytoplasmic iron level regulating protein YaaA (DUF328/UPF0246 family)
VINQKNDHLMKIVIITDDSGSQLPSFNKWKNQFGKGLRIDQNNEILSLLTSEKLTCPTDDITNEDKYRTILKEFVRPAKFMFSGMFVEVRDFSLVLTEIKPADLYIISGRYGLINQNKSIIPYHHHINNPRKLKELDEQTDFVTRLLNLVSNSRLAILLLPSHFIEYLMIQNFFDEIDRKTPIIIVTAEKFENSFKSYPNIIFYQRRGVARIGKSNQNKIISIVKKLD